MIKITEAEIMNKWIATDDGRPLVSIRCLAYNHEKYIEQAIDGFLMQETTFPFEIVIHDDASTDHTADIIRQYAKEYPNIIRPIYETENQYSKKDGSLRRIMDKALRGRYTALCEGDDLWISREKLQKQVSFLESHDEYTMVFHAANYLKNGEIIKNDRHNNVECNYSTDDLIRGGGAFCATCSLCFRTSAFLDRYLFQLSADVGDHPLQIAMSLKGKVHYFPDIMSSYRVSQGGDSSWSSTMGKKDQKIAHLNKTIEWLSVLNQETNGVYKVSIQYVITNVTYEQYLMGAVKKKELIRAIGELRSKERVYMVKEIIKHTLAIKFPLAYEQYRKRRCHKN